MNEIVFRVDASTRIGTGHVMRCLTLADELRRRGAQCTFIHRTHDGHMTDVICSRGHDVVNLPSPVAGQGSQVADDSSYADWLGVNVAEDAEQTIAALGKRKPDWLVVDHYALGQAWESRMRKHVGRIAVVDDLANRPHDADLLLDQTYSPGGGARYDGLLPPSARRLCSARYALLDPVYAKYREQSTPRSGAINRVFLFFGGTDPNNLTGMALKALIRPEFHHLAVDVVIGANNPHSEILKDLARQGKATTLHGPRPHLADLMAFADLAVGAGGTTTWERCCLGLPSLVVSIAENQRFSCEMLARDGIIAYAGHWDRVDTDKVAEALRQLVSDPVRLEQMARLGKQIVDGGGPRHVVDELELL